MDYSNVIAVFVEMVEYAFPVAFVFAFGAKIVTSFLHMAFNGEVRF